MANAGYPNSNNSQFFITVVPCLHLKDKNVVIGEVIKGFNIIQEISETPTDNDKPLMV